MHAALRTNSHQAEEITRRFCLLVHGGKMQSVQRIQEVQWFNETTRGTQSKAANPTVEVGEFQKMIFQFRWWQRDIYLWSLEYVIDISMFAQEPTQVVVIWSRSKNRSLHSQKHKDTPVLLGIEVENTVLIASKLRSYRMCLTQSDPQWRNKKNHLPILLMAVTQNPYRRPGNANQRALWMEIMALVQYFQTQTKLINYKYSTVQNNKVSAIMAKLEKRQNSLLVLTLQLLVTALTSSFIHGMKVARGARHGTRCHHHWRAVSYKNQ